MRSGFDKRLADLEQAQRATRQTGGAIERYTVDGEEHVQQFWNGKPFGGPWHAWMWDAWEKNPGQWPEIVA